MTIDWTKPICLDTVPPRMAMVAGKSDADGDARVIADWDDDDEQYDKWIYGKSGRAIHMASHYPTVRNVRPGDFAPDPRDAAIAGLVEALRRSGEGWANALELGLIPERHRNTATILADEARAALTAWEAVK